jgi:hypothetical protein
MRNRLKAFFVAVVVMVPIASAEAQQPSSSPGDRLVMIAPCRLVDTRVSVPLSPAEESARKIDVASTRCGRFVPSASTAYTVRTTSYERASDGKTPTQAAGAAASLSRHPAGPPITFPVPPGSHITVDLEGYYVPPNTPVDPTLESASANVTTESVPQPTAPKAASSGTPLRPKTEFLENGTAGEMYLDASRVGDTGVFGIASSAHPWVKLMSGTSNGLDGIGVYNGNYSELMRVSSDGPTRLILGWSYLSGRTDYRETTSVPNNTVHEVRIVDPRDSAGGATSRVTFFDAKTDSEVNSPATTKFRAYTYGSTTQSHINFDSQIVDHNSNQYYFRGFSVYDPNGVGKETFWVKAATNGGAFDNTRADMYVSGNVSIGTTNPATKLDVTDAVYAGTRLTGVGQQVSVLRGGYNAGYYSEISSYIPAGAPGIDSIGWKIRPYYYASPTGGRFDAVTITPAGKVGIGIDPTALLQLAPPSGTAGFAQSANGTFTVDASGVAGGRLAILEDGRVGIGIGNMNPDARLQVAGTGHFTGNVTVDGIIYAKYQDVAEWVPSEGTLPAGTVVVLNRLKTNAVAPSAKAYDTAVAGVVSDQPGVLLGVAGDNKAKIATTGRVKVHVDARAHAVNIGDLLVTSDLPGTAMLSEPLDLGGVKIHRPGTIIGKALEPLAGGQGQILVLLSLQ